MAHIRSESASTATSYATARSDTGSDYIEKASDGGDPDYYGETEEERTTKKLNQVIMVRLERPTAWSTWLTRFYSNFSKRQHLPSCPQEPNFHKLSVPGASFARASGYVIRLLAMWNLPHQFHDISI